jgi:peptidoglycan/LPS O-acetylase OafA/YrhL
LGGAIPHLYFISVLIQLTILTPVIHYIIAKRNNFIHYVFVLATPLYLLLIYYFTFTYKKLPPFYFCIFPAWFSYYYLGIYIKSNETIKQKIKTLLPVTIVALFLIALLFSCFESFIIFDWTKIQGFANSQIRFGTFFYSLVFIVLIFVLKPEKNTKSSLFSRIGDYSFGIYLIHGFVLAGLNYCLSFIRFPDYLFILWQSINVAFTISVSYYIICLLDRFLPDKAIKLIGLK